MRDLLRVLAVAPALLVAACSGGSEQTAATGPATPATLPAAYSYTLTSSCGERSLIGTYRVRVADGVVTDVDPRGRAMAPPDLGDVPTIADLEAMIGAAEPDAVVEVERDVDGLLTSVSIDHVPDAIDDEECYAVSGLRERAGGGG